MPRRTKQEAEKTRAALLRAAEQVFYEKGVVSASLHEIARMAGVTRGAVYWHFKDKAEILRTLADDIYFPHEDLLSRMGATDMDDPLGALHAEVCASLNALTNDPRRRRLLTVLTQRCEYIEEMEKMIRRNNECRDRMKERLQVIFEQARRKGLLSSVWTAQTAMQALQSMIMGFIYNEMDWPKPSRTRDKERNETIAALFAAFGNDGQTS